MDAVRRQSSYSEILRQKFKGVGQSYDVLMATYVGARPFQAMPISDNAHFKQCYVRSDPVSRKHFYKSEQASDKGTLVVSREPTQVPIRLFCL